MNTTKQRWLAVLRAESERAENWLIEHGELPPMVMFYNDQKMVIMKGISGGSGDEKDRALMLLRTVGVAIEATAAAVINEAWMRPIARRHGESEADQQARALALPPSQAEDRIEIVSVIMTWREGTKIKQASSLREIMRNEQGDVIGLGPERFDPKENPQGIGRMTEILSPRPARTEMVREARALLAFIGATIEELPFSH